MNNSTLEGDVTREEENARAYGYFDALYGRASELPEGEPLLVQPYLDGYSSGQEERRRMNTREPEVPYTGPTVRVRSWLHVPSGRVKEVRAEHGEHGRGRPDRGPDEPDCGCRGTEKQAECAWAGCGFCGAAERAAGRV